MIHYVVAENPDERLIVQACKILAEGGIISFPTDTNWVFAANPFIAKGVDNLYKIKSIDRKRHLSLLCNNISQASKYAHISDSTYKLIKRKIPGPYTFIFNPLKAIPRAIKEYRKDKEVGIRFPNSILCQRIIETFENPIIATSICPTSIKSYDPNQESIYSYQIEATFGNQLEMIIDPSLEVPLLSSTIISFANDDIPEIIREGAGDISPFI